MNASGSRTHELILDTAIRLFMEKGYEAVTMSDFCSACGLSRGGLYRHFNSTAEIFEAMLMRDKDDWAERMTSSFECGVSAGEMFKFYLDAMEKGILNKEGRLSLAAYEYVRSNKEAEAFSKKRYNAAVDMMKTILDYGNKRGEFHIEDIEVMARHLVIFMDGLRLAAVFSLTEDEVHGQINHIYQLVTREEL